MRIRNPNCLVSHGNVEGRKHALEILEAGLQAADPYHNTKLLLSIRENKLYVGFPDFVPAGSPHTEMDVYDLKKDLDRIFVFGAGKGIQRIAQALEEILGEHLTGGLILLKHHDQHCLHKIQVFFGGHPIPDEGCVKGCQEMVKMIQDYQLTSRDLVFTILGNGASSLLTLPWEDLSLEDVQSVTQIIQIEKGLLTPQLNLVRNQLDQLKGGTTTRLLALSTMVHLIPIDLNEPNAFGDAGYAGLMKSNFWLHTLPDISSPAFAVKLLKDFELWEQMPIAVRHHLQNPCPEQEVMHPQEFEALDCRIFGLMPTTHNFIPITMQAAKALGYQPHFLMRRTFVEASAAGQLISRIALNVANEQMPFQAPCALFLTGELTVAVEKETGIGGRNQEFAMSAATVIQGNKRIVVAAVDTDGTDGPGGRFDENAWAQGCHNLAGGIVDGFTMEEAAHKQINIEEALRSHATSQALWKLDSGIWASQNISIQDLIVVLVMDHDGIFVEQRKELES